MAVTRGVGRAGVPWVHTGREFRLHNVEQVTANINKALAKIKGKSAVGLRAAANHVLNDADHGTPPLVPQDTGNLRSSRFVDPPRRTRAGEIYVKLGYGANYAAAVHEMLQSPSGLPINWQRPGSGPRFFVKSLQRNSENIVRIVAEHARL